MEEIKFVDMGTGVLWADRNINAISPVDSGNLYSTSNKSYFYPIDRRTHRYKCKYISSDNDFSENLDTEWYKPDFQFPYYVYSSNTVYNILDISKGRSNFELNSMNEFDDFCLYYGSEYKTPSINDYIKLIESSKKEYIINQNGEGSVVFTSNINNNSLYFPFMRLAYNSKRTNILNAIQTMYLTSTLCTLSEKKDYKLSERVVMKFDSKLIKLERVQTGLSYLRVIKKSE